jgi:hypothetical protein
MTYFSTLSRNIILQRHIICKRIITSSIATIGAENFI